MLSHYVFRLPAPAACGGSVGVFAGHDVRFHAAVPTLSMKLGQVRAAWRKGESYETGRG